MTDGSDIDFFGMHITVRSTRLAALLNSSVTEDVVVVGKRALDMVSPDDREVGAAVAPDDAEGATEIDAEHLDELFERLQSGGDQAVVRLRRIEP